MQAPSYGIFLMFMFAFMLFLPDSSGYYLERSKADRAAEHILDEAKKTGQIDVALVSNVLAAQNLSPSDWSITYTQGQVAYNEPMVVQIEGKYRMKAFYAIGQAFGDSVNSDLSIKIKRQEVSQVYVRN